MHKNGYCGVHKSDNTDTQTGIVDDPTISATRLFILSNIVSKKDFNPSRYNKYGSGAKL